MHTQQRDAVDYLISQPMNEFDNNNRLHTEVQTVVPFETATNIHPLRFLPIVTIKTQIPQHEFANSCLERIVVALLCDHHHDTLSSI
jgi:hypothetical protein